jgi:hypothetical protein
VLWISAVSIGTRGRVARYFTDVIENLTELGRLPGNPEPESDRKRQVILDEARRQIFPVISRKGKPPSLSEERPSKTKLSRLLLDAGGDQELGALIYVYYSAVAHGTNCGLLQRFEKTASDNPLSTQATATSYVSTADINSVLSALILGYGRAVKEHFDLMGWTGKWIEAYASAHHVLAAYRLGR